MPHGNINRHPSYNNRYRRSSNEGVEGPRAQLPSVTEETSDLESPKSPDPMVTAKTRRAMFMESRSMSNGNKMKSINLSTDSTTEDVFVDMNDQREIITDPTDIIKMVEKRQIRSTSSTASILPNPYNKINHRVHSMFWCTCCLYFMFICCLPGVHYMQESDKAFRQGDDKKAQRLGKMATLMFIAGTLFSVSIYAAILFVVIFFTAYS